jgi:phage shock protein A
MNIWTKMIDALKGESNQQTESIIDGRALRLLDDELRTSSLELKQSKDALAQLLAQQKLANEGVQLLSQHIKQHEGYAREALAQGNEALALDVAEKIVELEADRQQEVEICDNYSVAVKNLQRTVKQFEIKLKQLKQQVDTVKATQSVQRAQKVILDRHQGSTSRMQTAQDSLHRLKDRQASTSARYEVEGSQSDDVRRAALIEKLEAAGIHTESSQASEVLARLKKQ